MKKFLLIAIALLSCAALFSEGWEKQGYVGFVVPITFTNLNNDETQRQISYGAELAAVFIHPMRLSARFAFDFALGRSDDYLPDTTGLKGELKIGLGFTPLKTESFQFSVFGTGGVGLLYYNYAMEHSDSNIYMRMTEWWVSVGADAMLAIHFSKTMGMYLNLGVYKIFPGDISFNWENLSSKIPTSGGWRIVPAIGVKKEF